MTERRAITVTITVPGHPFSPNKRRRSHWTRQREDTETFRALVAWQALAVAAREPGQWPVQRARVAIILQRPDKHWYDPDAAYGVVKPLVDGLIGHLLVDDSAAHIDLVVAQQHGARRQCVITVEPRERVGE